VNISFWKTNSNTAAKVVLVFFALIPLYAQRELSGSAQIQLALDRLNVTGSVLLIAAHPDDENTALLAYFARGKKLRTGYLSLTRGEGGQNLIGPDQGDALGVIRTQELLAARRIDGAEQFFTRAIDFGFTKTPEETFEKWGHERILSDVVWVIRKFRPNLIVLRFSGTTRDGHGQHQVSAILGKEAFSAAADPKRFPEQLPYVQTWQATRLMWNVFAFTPEQEKEAAKIENKVEIDPGDYDPILGHSYGEIAGMSRSQHKSQGMGTMERKGSQKNFLVTVAGPVAKSSAFDGIDISWDSVPRAGELARVLRQAADTFQPAHPERTTPLLLKARVLLAELQYPQLERKLQEIDEAIALTAGLSLEATADKFATVPGGSFEITATAINRGPLRISLDGKDLPYNKPETKTETRAIAANTPYSQPYWLREPEEGAVYTVRDQELIGLAENPPLLHAKFHLRCDGREFEVERAVVYRYADRVRGELTRPLIVEPQVSVKTPRVARMFPDPETRAVEVAVTANVKSASGSVSIQVPDGWRVKPEAQDFHFAQPGEETMMTFQVTPPSRESRGELHASAKVGDHSIRVGMDVIAYEHIPPQALFPPAETNLVRSDIRNLAHKLGYIMGAGDQMPDALRQIGSTVTLLSASDLARGDLSSYDAIITGVRAYNTRADLRTYQNRLLEYVKNGGRLIVQYNVVERAALEGIGPYPFKVGGERVTVEEAPVATQNTDLRVFHEPNEINAHDFASWIQERGLNFASEWDPHYKPLFETHDPGQKPQLGGTLFAPYGKGVYIFTAFAWFRQLPAGVPGAYRIFANFMSAQQ
jgi:LmbE family N-acetylglucosaminyl deacetylase